MTDQHDQAVPPGPGRKSVLQWQAALTLAERLSEYGRAPTVRRHGLSKKTGRRLRWREERRIDIAHTTAQPLSCAPPGWVQTLEAAYDDAERLSPGYSNGLLNCVEPLLGIARSDVRAELDRLGTAVHDGSSEGRDALLASLEKTLQERLYETVSKALVLELGVLSARNMLKGSSPEERYAFFCSCLADPGFAYSLLAQYPVLVRRMTTIVGNWQSATKELLARLTESYDALRKTFWNSVDPGPLVSVESSGDTHCNGRAVHILAFASGQKLVYKPRSVAMEGWFFDLVRWLNDRGCDPDLKVIRSIDRGDFGWMEFVGAMPCHSKDEVERFFVRQGAQVALAYICGGSDLHFENVIAHGEYPVLVDLETLFQAAELPTNLEGATGRAWRELSTSIMGTVLLPEQTYSPDLQGWADLSALGYSDGQLTPSRVPVWRAAETDRMRLTHDRVPMEAGSSLPELDRQKAQVFGHSESVVQGLERMYAFLSRHKDELLSDQGPLRGCLGKPVRYVFRNTGMYAALLDASNHPRYLTNALATEAFLHNRMRAEAVDSPWLATVEDVEVDALIAGDIPYFTSAVGERRMTISDGGTLELTRNGWDECCSRIAAMGEDDLDRQKWLARVALADLSGPVNLKYGPGAHASESKPDRLIATATRIGERLCETAIVDGERATWLVPVFAGTDRLCATVADYDVYDGLPGIALFLAHLAEATGERRFRAMALSAMSEAIALAYAAKKDEMAFGAFDGASGLAYTMVHLAPILDRPEWTREAIGLLRKAAAEAERSPEVDVIAGRAGVVLAGLAAFKATGDESLIELLRPHVATLTQLPERSGKMGRPMLPVAADAGLAHGRAGIGIALSRWGEATGTNALDALATEMIRFDWHAIEGMRSKSASQNAGRHETNHLGWCRGFLGIAMSVSEADQNRHASIPDRASWSRTAVTEMVDLGIEGPLCLCHGALGRTEFMASAIEPGSLGESDQVKAWRRDLYTRISSGNWSADHHHALESPGLMLGLAGTGYSLLRASGYRGLPAVLTLGSPSIKS